ncbi:MAG TPA: glycosyltransferase family 2 protein [Glaciibacter sp.]|nr:glycosyltransferase family 2 protein [Glaciibacter sp.]
MSATGADPTVAVPVASIIVPAYNAATSLEATITALLGQTRDDFEIVVVDDGSTDATGTVAARLAEQHPRVRSLPLPENRGVARAREHAARHSRGEYLWFIDADDRPEPNALDRLVAAARLGDADVVVCSAQFVDEEGKRRPIPAPELAAPMSGRRAFRMLLEGQITGHLWNKLFRRNLVDAIEFTPARVHSDLAMVAQLLAAAHRVTSIPDVLYSYHLRGGSIIHSGSRRAESLRLIDAAVHSAAGRLDPRILRTREYRYFRFRFIVLSGVKDAVLGPYTDAERRNLVAELRVLLTWRSLLLPVLAGDWRRLTLGLAAKVSRPLYRRVLGIANSRAGGPTQVT